MNKFSNLSHFSQVSILVAVIGISYLVVTPPIYQYGVSNQANQLPLIKHTMDPTYLMNDWVVNQRTGIGSPRFYYINLIALLAPIFGTYNVIFTLYVLSFLFICTGIWLIVQDIYDDRLAATLAVAVILSHKTLLPPGIPYPPSLGGNSLFGSMLFSSQIANSFIVFGILYAIRKRYEISFSLLGLGTIFHVVNGFWMALVIGICILRIEFWPKLSESGLLKSIQRIPLKGVALYILISSIAIIPLLIENINADQGFEAVYLNAWVRHPHHFIPSTWPLIQTIATVIFILLSVIIIYRYREIVFDNPDRRVFAFTYVITIISIMGFGGFVFTELLPIGKVILLQPFHIQGFLYIILYGGIINIALISLSKLAGPTSVNPKTFCTIISIILVISFTIVWGTGFIFITNYTTKYNEYDIRYLDKPNHPQSLESSYNWIEKNTPRDAIFLAPPNQEGFRLGTSRARVVNFKSFPFRSEAMIEWKNRMNEVCNGDIRGFDQRGFELETECSERFNDMNESEIRDVARKYSVNYILSKNESYNMSLRHSAGEYYIYEINIDE